MPKLSVIIPAYNVEKYIRGCLDSIEAQSFQDFECIIIDDGSEDDTNKICQEYVKQNPKLKLYSSKHEGVAFARNTGLSKATGEYMIFIDSDDDIHPNMFEIMIQQLEEHSADVVECGINYIDTTETVQYKCCRGKEIVSGRDILIRYCDEGWLVHFIMCNKMFRRSLFDEIYFPINKVHEDEYVQYQVLYRAKKAVLIEDCMYQYYRRKGSIMNCYTSKRINCYIDFSLNRIRYFEDKDREVFNAMLKVFYVTVFENYDSCQKTKLCPIYTEILITIAKYYFKDFKKIKDVSFIGKLSVWSRILKMKHNMTIATSKCY